MAEVSIKQSLQVVVNELKISTKGGLLDISKIYEEINIFDSIFNPCITGNILINDAVGLSEKLLFDGSEMLIMHLSKTGDDFPIKRSFRIYKQTDRKNVNQNSEVYILHFVSDEFIFSEQQRINQAYNTTYAETAVKIMIDYLGVPVHLMRGNFDSSVGVKNFIIPNLKPIEAIEWCAKRAVDANSSPSFIFFENRLGYNFTTLSTLLTQKTVGKINFSPKNLNSTIGNGIVEEINGARDVKILSQFDFVKNVQNGVYAGKFIGFDPLSRTKAEKPITFRTHYDTTSHANKTENLVESQNRAGVTNTQMFNSKKVLSPFTIFRRDSNYIKLNDTQESQKDDDTYKYIFQRQAIFTNLLNQRLQLTLPGNFNYTAGLMVDVEVPKRFEKTKDDDNRDKTLYGKYLIIATRHVIGFNKHEVIMEVATDSSNRGGVYSSSVEQSKSVYYK